jgi:hypothetical protein
MDWLESNPDLRDWCLNSSTSSSCMITANPTHVRHWSDRSSSCSVHRPLALISLFLLAGCQVSAPIETELLPRVITGWGATNFEGVNLTPHAKRPIPFTSAPSNAAATRRTTHAGGGLMPHCFWSAAWVMLSNANTLSVPWCSSVPTGICRQRPELNPTADTFRSLCTSLFSHRSPSQPHNSLAAAVKAYQSRFDSRRRHDVSSPQHWTDSMAHPHKLGTTGKATGAST